MTLEEKINEDLIKALKSGDKAKRQVLGLVKAALSNARIAAKLEKLSNEAVLEVLAHEVKSRKDAASEFRKGRAEERAQAEEAEAATIEAYLPAQLSSEEIEKKVDKIIARLGASNVRQMGQVMGAISKELKGKADLGQVNKIVRKKLSA